MGKYPQLHTLNFERKVDLENVGAFCGSCVKEKKKTFQAFRVKARQARPFTYKTLIESTHEPANR